MVKNKKRRAAGEPMLFSAWNYKVLALGLLLVVTGFTAMYMENEIEGFISLYVSPILIMAGYISVIFAIMRHDRSENDQPEQAS